MDKWCDVTIVMNHGINTPGRVPGVVTGAAVVVVGGWWRHIIRAATKGKKYITYFYARRHCIA